jgi:hypothetical protein
MCLLYQVGDDDNYTKMVFKGAVYVIFGKADGFTAVDMASFT